MRCPQQMHPFGLRTGAGLGSQHQRAAGGLAAACALLVLWGSVAGEQGEQHEALCTAWRCGSAHSAHVQTQFIDVSCDPSVSPALVCPARQRSRLQGNCHGWDNKQPEV